MLGTLVGAGGGFLLVPVLVFLYPDESVDRVTAMSMAVVFFNALSGTAAYAAMRRIDFPAGRIFALAAVPGAFLGAVATAYISRMIFERILGAALIVIASFLLIKNGWRGNATVARTNHAETFVLDVHGKRRGAAISALVGFVSSALGIGGGIVHVPALVYVLGYPVHLATATSHFVLACTSLIAVGEHILHGSYTGNIERTLTLSIGAVVGAQLGAKLSKRVKGHAIVAALAVALIFAGLRIVLRTFG